MIQRSQIVARTCSAGAVSRFGSDSWTLNGADGSLQTGTSPQFVGVCVCVSSPLTCTLNFARLNSTDPRLSQARAEIDGSDRYDKQIHIDTPDR